VRLEVSHLPPGKLRLPYWERAFIPTNPGKNRLKDYALKPDHHEGSSKADLFRRRLGIVQDDWQYLHDQIIDNVRHGWVRRIDVKVVRGGDPLLRVGLKIEVHVPIIGRQGERCEILTGWRLDSRMAPFLTTTWPSSCTCSL
jgi:hypothetical protein